MVKIARQFVRFSSNADKMCSRLSNLEHVNTPMATHKRGSGIRSWALFLEQTLRKKRRTAFNSLCGAFCTLFLLYSSFRIRFSAFFSRRETWAWDIPTSADTSIWVLP